uniref:Uncharacterized protein n=1 Tax=Arundo donax TaxID=35708 RepID=A0A0A8XW63_ARUDO
MRNQRPVGPWKPRIAASRGGSFLKRRSHAAAGPGPDEAEDRW